MYRTQILEKPNKTKWLVDTADHIEDIVKFIRDTKPQWPDGEDRSSERPGDGEYGRKWSGTDSLEEALKLAEYGWPGGRKMMAESLDAADVAQRAIRHKTEGLDVGGSYPFVPAAVAGDPMCMVTRGLDMARTRPAFRLMVSGVYSASISANVIMNRGAAILSWADRLENMGFTTDIYNVASVHCYASPSSKNGERPYRNVTMGFPVKLAGEPLDIDRAAFMLAHPAMLRRLWFATCERHAELSCGFSSGYGSVSNEIPEPLQVPHSVYFSQVHGNDFASPATAIAAVERQILEALQQDELDKDKLTAELEDA